MFTLLLITEFAIFNPLVLPFALVYFCAARGDYYIMPLDERCDRR
jgi:hypothetical protein